MPRSQIKLVCFDIGGVLIRICRDWAEACSLVGLPVPAAIGDPAVLAKLTQASDRHELDQCDAECFARQAAELTGLTTRQIELNARAWLRGPYPGLPEMIETEKRAHENTACLSNTNRFHWAAMTDAKGPNFLPLSRLDHHFTSFAAGHMKPSAAIFRWVEKQAALPPSQILFFDDSAENVRGALACGWRSEQIDATNNPPAQVLGHLKRYEVL